MTSLLIKLLISLVLIWLLVMYNIWREEMKIKIAEEYKVLPIVNKLRRVLRRFWFAILRVLSKLKDRVTFLATKLFFKIFPGAKKVFEPKDKLIGLDHGPSSYFLKSLSNEKDPKSNEPKPDRRKSKNV